MNPFIDPKNPSLYDQVTIQNIDSQPFEIIYDNQSYGYINPNEIRRLPKFLAEHVVKHLLDQTLNHMNLPTNHPVKRPELTAKIVLAEEALVRPITKTESQIIQEQIEIMNEPSDLEKILAQREQDPQPPIDPPATLNSLEIPEPLPVDTQTELNGSEVFPEDAVLNPAPETAPVIPVTDPAIDAERAKLLAFAENRLGINMNDEKTKAAWALMSNEELAQELAYEEGI